jgi:anaerobic magnesium-protoporphyrin IX monomethyl ester cyclase
MHIHILQVNNKYRLRTNKDTNSGYGTVNDFGKGLVASLLKYFKNGTMNFPEILPAYLNAILTQQGNRVTFSKNQLDPSAQIVIIQTSIINFNEELQTAAEIKASHPQIRIGFIGGISSANAELYDGKGDFVIRGEPENALLNGNIVEFSGIVDGGQVEDLDRLPFPDWSHIQNWEDRYGFVRVNRGRFLPMLSSRGCPMSCRYYCTYPLVQGTQFRSRTPENVIEEIIYLQQKFGMTTVLFRDPIFSLDMERIEAICNLILAKGLNFSWLCETHPRLLTPDLIALMAKAGCVAIKFGIESGNLEVMKKSHRASANLELQERIIRSCEQNQIDVLGFYILGFFDDTEETIRQTIEYAQKLNTFGAQFTIATPYPGTQWYQDLVQESDIYQLDQNLERYTQYQLVYKHPNLTHADLERLKSMAYQRYYLRPGYITKHFWKIIHQ